jgi:tetratricopeptide (TPR) repeat protein
MAALIRVGRGVWRASFIVAACVVMTLPQARAQSSSVASSADAARASLAEKAHALEARGRPDLAIQLWQQILLSDPRNAAALAGLAKDYRLIGSDALANQTLDRLRAINSNDSNIAGSQAKSSPSPKSRYLEGSPPSAPPNVSPNSPSPSDHGAVKVALNTSSPTASGPPDQHVEEKAPSARDAAFGAYSAPQPQQPTPPQSTQPDSSLSSSANTSSRQTTVPVPPPANPAPAKTPSAAPAPAIAQTEHKRSGNSTRQSASQSVQPQGEQSAQTLGNAPIGAPESASPNFGPALTKAQTQLAPTQQPQPETTIGATCLIAIPEPIGTYAGGYNSFDLLVSIFTASIQWNAPDGNQKAFTRSAGGYFSPQAYFLANAPTIWRGKYGPSWHYNFASAFGTRAFQQDTTPSLPPAGGTALETSQNNPTLPSLSAISPSDDLQSQVAYQIHTHWFTSAFLAANNTCNSPYISIGFFGRYTLRQPPSTLAAPSGLFSAAGPHPLPVR